MAHAIKMEAVMELREAINRFEEVLKGLIAHKLELTDKGECLTLSPGVVVTYKVKAKSEKKKEKLELSMTWEKEPV